MKIIRFNKVANELKSNLFNITRTFKLSLLYTAKKI